jgi:peroxin-5
MSKWESEFNQLMSAQRDDLDHDFGGAMKEAWESGVGDFSENIAEDKYFKFDSEGMPILSEYTFGITIQVPSSCGMVIDHTHYFFFRTK